MNVHPICSGLALLIGALGPLCPLAAQTPPRSPELQKLEAFVGTWTTAGKAEASPLGPARQWTGTLKGEWAPGGFSVIRYDDGMEATGRPDRAVFVFFWDTQAQSHRAFMVASDGSSDMAKLSFGPDTMTWTWEVPVKGKRILMRGTLQPLSAEVRDYEGAYSEDGKNWKVFERARDTRKK